MGKLENKKCVLHYSGNEMKFRQLGMGFIIDRSIEKYILSFEPLAEQTCKLQIKRTFLYFSIINILAPTENKEIAVKIKVL